METKQVEMTSQELAEFEQYKAEKIRKEKAERQRQNRETYKQLIDELIESSFPRLNELSKTLSHEKAKIFDTFHQAIQMKAEIYEVRTLQKSHTFTNKQGNKRITLGQYETDGYDDTVNEGISKVKQFISSLAKDKESEMLVNAIIRLLSKDQKGNLKASRIMQLKKMSEESENETFTEGVNIIEEAYRPQISKFYIRAEIKTDLGTWENIPLGITEA
ncbi:MAG: DUF3164 family protein [Bacteroidales bacterium]|jgi:hypothetical protein|nr:DUF3164 family protein [Bacteroidales bacterium]